MSIFTFLLGLACGAGLAILGFSFRALRLKRGNPVGADERYLMNVARAAGGRLIVKEERTASGPPMLRLPEVPDQKTLASKGQVDHLLLRGLLKPDPSGLPGRYLLTPEGWDFVTKLRPLPVVIKRAGNWFNSISRRPPR